MSRNSFARYYGRHLRALSDDKCYTVGCDDLGAPYLTIGTIFTVGAVIGRPCKIRKGATDDRPYEEYDGRQKPLLKERCHKVTEWWNKKRNAKRHFLK